MTATGLDAAGSASAATSTGWQPHIVAMVCNWCSYAGADMAGTTRIEYPANVRLVRFPCTGRMSPLMILRAFEQGADAVLVSGCHPGDCHYVQGNLLARRRFTIFRSLMEFIGLDLRRLHFAWVSAAEGAKWARVVSEVTRAAGEAGPLPSFFRPGGASQTELPPLTGSGPSELDDAQLDAIQSNLRTAASEALAAEHVVIGYRAGSLPEHSAPLFIANSDDCDKLEWGRFCHNNLSSYVSAAVGQGQRVAMVAKRCDVAAISGLIREGQLGRQKLRLIGVQCPGAYRGSVLAAKCLTCSGAPHPLCDVVVTVDGVRESRGDSASADLEGTDARDQQIAYLESLPHAARWSYWQRQFARCLRCYACRAACPLCYCPACIAEKHRPQWVPTAIDNRGNWIWNIIRALHLAGRCSGCDECARACPAGIRLDLINRKLRLEVQRHFGKVGLDPAEKSPLVDFRMEDSEEFIR